MKLSSICTQNLPLNIAGIIYPKMLTFCMIGLLITLEFFSNLLNFVNFHGPIIFYEGNTILPL